MRTVLLALTLLAGACAQAATPGPTAQPTAEPPARLSLAVLEDPSRDVFLFALENDLVTSPTLEIEVTKLPLALIIEAARSQQFDLIEAATTAVPLAAAGGFKFLIFSPGIVSHEGAPIFVPASSEVEDLAGLEGKTLGTPSLGSSVLLEARYLLQQAGLDVSFEGGDVAFQEVAAEAATALLVENRLDAALLIHAPAFRLLSEPQVRVLVDAHVAFREATGADPVASVLVTYPKVVEDKGDLLEEARRLLRESADYARENHTEVVEAVARTSDLRPEFVDWWTTVQDFRIGDAAEEFREGILALWNAARDVGEVESLPALEDHLAP